VDSMPSQETAHEQKQKHQQIFIPDPAAPAGGDRDHVGRARVGERGRVAGGDQPDPPAGYGRAGVHRRPLGRTAFPVRENELDRCKKRYSRNNKYDFVRGARK